MSNMEYNWERFVLNSVQGGISVNKAREIFIDRQGKGENLPIFEIDDIPNLSRVHKLCSDAMSLELNLDLDQIIENEDIFYSPCDEFGLYNVLNWLLHPNWGNDSITSRFADTSNAHALVHILIEHGLSPTMIDLPHRVNDINNDMFDIGDIIKYIEYDSYVTGKIVDITTKRPPNDIIRHDFLDYVSEQKWYLILPLGWSPKYSEWTPLGALIKISHDKDQDDDVTTILKRFKIHFKYHPTNKNNDLVMNKIYESILSGQDANLKRRNLIKSYLLDHGHHDLSPLIEYIILPYLFME